MAKFAVARRRWLVPCVLFLAGCGRGGEGPPPAPPAGGGATVVPGLVGRWDVVSYGRGPLPAGVAVTVDYHPDGKVTLETKGDPHSAPTIDRDMLKRVMDDVGKQFGGLRTIKVEQGGPKPSEAFAIELRKE